MNEIIIISVILSGCGGAPWRLRWDPSQHGASDAKDPLFQFKARLTEDTLRQYSTETGHPFWMRGTAVAAWWLD